MLLRQSLYIFNSRKTTIRNKGFSGFSIPFHYSIYVSSKQGSNWDEDQTQNLQLIGSYNSSS